MKFTILNNQIALYNTNQELLAEVTFPDVDDYTVNVNHTFVDDSLKGQGVASELMLALADKLRSDQKRAVLSCSYAIHWFNKHAEYQDIIV